MAATLSGTFHVNCDFILHFQQATAFKTGSCCGDINRHKEE